MKLSKDAKYVHPRLYLCEIGILQPIMILVQLKATKWNFDLATGIVTIWNLVRSRTFGLEFLRKSSERLFRSRPAPYRKGPNCNNIVWYWFVEKLLIGSNVRRMVYRTVMMLWSTVVCLACQHRSCVVLQEGDRTRFSALVTFGTLALSILRALPRHFRSIPLYKHLMSVFVCVRTDAHFINSCGSSSSLQHHLTRCGARLTGPVHVEWR